MGAAETESGNGSTVKIGLVTHSGSGPESRSAPAVLLQPRMRKQKRTLARFNSDGSLDSTFGVGGYVLGDGAYSVILQPDGKIVTAGQTNAIPGDFALIRYQNRGGRRSPRQITSS